MSTSLFAMLAAAALQPGPDITLPAPTGVNAVGLATYEWVDSARIDSLSSPPGPRRILGRVWYPALRESRGSAAPYVPATTGATNDWLLLHARVRTHSQTSVPFAAGIRRAPVIVFAPGRSTATFDYTTLGEDLASHGYVVIGVDSPHHSKVVLADGSLAPIRFPSMGPSTYPDGFDAAQEPMNRLVGADLRFVVRRLEALDRDDPLLRGRLDLQRVGLAGHSNGGMAGSRACAAEALCRTFLGIEGMQTRELRRGGVAKPYGLVYSEQTLAFDTLGIFTELRLHAIAPFVLYRVNGAGHNSFTDLLIVRPTLFTYRMDPVRGVDVTRTIVRAYFDRELSGVSAADSAVTRLPEVKVERFGPPASSRSRP
jgi:hypothetical protein